MVENEAPSEDEIATMVELYGEYDSYQDVAGEDVIDWSRPTVTKWVKRVQEMAELYEDLGSFEEVADDDDVVWGTETVQNLVETWEAECMDGLLNPDRDNDPMSAGPDDEPREEPEGDYTADHPVEQVDEDDARETATERTGAAAAVDGAGGSDEEVPPEEQYAHVLEDKPDSPNEVLLDVLKAEPNLDDDHIGYIRSQLEYRGMMSPEEVVALMDDMSISSKNKTIARVRRDYNQRLNQVMRENDNISQYDDWATYLTKITGDPDYVKDTGVGGAGGDDVLQVPPNQQPAGQEAGGQAVPAAQTPESHTQTVRPDPNQQRAAPAQHQQGQPNQTAGMQPRSRGGQQNDGLSAFEERLIGMLEEQMDDSDSTPQQQQPAQQSEPESPTDQIEELLTLQQKVEQLTGGDDSNDQNAQVEALIEQMQSQINALTEQVNSDDGQQAQPQAQASGNGEMGMVEKMAVLSERVDDPEIIQAVMEMETDPEVLEAKAKREEIENESAWKAELASALSPNAVEKGMEFLSKLTPQQQAQVAQQRPAQPQQAQPAQPAQQQPQQAQPAQQPSQQATDVQRAEPNPQPEGSEEDDSPDTSSPLRESGKEKLADAESDADGDDGEEAEAEADTESEEDGEEQ
jgi:hypothetical protein